MQQNAHSGLRLLPKWLWGLLIACGAVSAYFVLRSGFCADDYFLLWEARHPFWESVHRYLVSPDVFSQAYYRPVQRLVHLFEFKVFGDIAILYHTVSLLIHLLNAFLAYRFFNRLGAPTAVSGIAAIVFVIHPAHTEPVTFISALSGLLAATFLLSALNVLLHHLETGDRRSGWAVILASVLALLSKEDTISLPITLGIVWWFQSRRRDRLWPVLTTVPLVAAWLLWRVAIGGVLDPSVSGFSANPLTVLRNLPFHLSRFVISVRSLARLVGFDHYYALRDALHPTPHSVLYISAVVLIVALVGYGVWRGWRRWPVYVKTGLGIAISGLLLYLPLPESATRFLYFPIVGLSVAAVGLLLLNASWPRRVILYVWISVLALSAVEQTSTWYQAGQRVEVVLAEAVNARENHPPEVGTVFVDYPRREYAAFVFPIALEYAIRWETDFDWPYLFVFHDLPLDPNTAPDSVVWYRWSGDRFVPMDPQNW